MRWRIHIVKKEYLSLTNLSFGSLKKIFLPHCQGLKVPVLPVARLKASPTMPQNGPLGRDFKSRKRRGRGFQPLTKRAKTYPKLRLTILLILRYFLIYQQQFKLNFR